MEEANSLTEFTKYPASLSRSGLMFFVEFQEATIIGILKDHNINDSLVIILFIGLTNTMQTNTLFKFERFDYILML